MTQNYAFKVELVGTEVQLIDNGQPIPFDLWGIEAVSDRLRGADLAQRLIAESAAIADGQTLLVDHHAVASFSNDEASSLGLPGLTEAVAHIETAGLITTPEFKAKIIWQRSNGQAVVGARRVGAWLRIANEWQRLPKELFDIAEAIQKIDEAVEGDIGAKLAALATLREVLPQAEATSKATATGLIGNMTIAVADAFSLDLIGNDHNAKLVPILHRAGGDLEAPLLSEEHQKAFGIDQFNRFGSARPVYTLGGGWYVVLSPSVRRALAEIRKVQSAPLATKRAVMSSPRAFLRNTFNADDDDTVVETVFRDTDLYAERVIGLGLWSPRVLPWIKLPPSNWFGPEGEAPPSAQPPAEAAGIIIGDRSIPLSPEAAENLRVRIEAALGAGETTVSLNVEGEQVAVPASYETLSALEALRPAQEGLREKATSSSPSAPEVLVIRPNEDGVELEGEFRRRPAPQLGLPRLLAATLKDHQREGLEWLQKAWMMGNPGVLLADDMGLGKTVQGLAFLTWLRQAMVEGLVPRQPILIVAPTGLLANWRAEHDRHLHAPGLGRCVEAFGKSLARLRTKAADGGVVIDTAMLQGADWVLTTYETLRDYDKDFGRVRFSVAMFDEAQKIKTPSVRVTDAAKAMNAEFRVALTGTPVENRLADLWCITDAVHPAYLEDLKSFSKKYESNPDASKLQSLKRTLDTWYGDRPPLLLRRLKEDRLPDLPKGEERVLVRSMPPRQREAYEGVIAMARSVRKQGAVLEALQRLRAVSLHPDSRAVLADEDFIKASARMAVCFEALDEICEKGERVLIFLDDLHLQARLVGLIQRRFRLPSPPMVINGEVDGFLRQARVDMFQDGSGFDAMILSPRAGGVGLTLTNANHVIHLSRWWNPAVEDQCTGRVLRIGQLKDVTIHVPLATLPGGRVSFDQNLQALLQRKRRLMRDALMPPAATEQERRELFENTVN